MLKRLGILTGGGDCPGLNAVIRSVTKAAIRYGYEVIGFRDGYQGLVDNRFLPLHDALVSGILTQGGTILGASNKTNPYRWIVPRASKKDQRSDVSKTAIRTYRKQRLSGLIVTGGDGTMGIAHRLEQDGLRIIGIPKTIDNDLPGTDVTFGFETAVITATEAIDKIHTTAQSHHRAMVIEVMGRYAGWIALYAGVAGGGDIILIPEIPYRLKHVIEKIKMRRKMGKRFSIIVVSEGAKPAGGSYTIQKMYKTRTDPIRLGGIGNKIAEELERAKIEARAVVLGHVQRGGSPTPFDRILATRFGTEAVNLAAQDRFGRMVVYRNREIFNISLEEAAGSLKLVPPDHPLITSARVVGTCFGDQ